MKLGKGTDQKRSWNEKEEQAGERGRIEEV